MSAGCTRSFGPGLAYLTALLTLVRLLAGVHPGMHRKSGALDELLSTPRKVAPMRPDAAVDSLCSHISGSQQTEMTDRHTMAGEIASPRKGLSTCGAGIRLRGRRASSLLGSWLVHLMRHPRHEVLLHLLGDHGRRRHVGIRHRGQGRCGHRRRGRVRRVHRARVARVL